MFIPIERPKHVRHVWTCLQYHPFTASKSPFAIFSIIKIERKYSESSLADSPINVHILALIRDWPCGSHSIMDVTKTERYPLKIIITAKHKRRIEHTSENQKKKKCCQNIFAQCRRELLPRAIVGERFSNRATCVTNRSARKWLLRFNNENDRSH